MNSKNITAIDKKYFQMIKNMPCGVCGASAPSDAHHIEQGLHCLSIPLCKDCHQGSRNGIHGQRFIWKALKKDELSVLNDTIKKVISK